MLLFISMCYCLRTRDNLKCVKILEQFINKRDEGLNGGGRLNIADWNTEGREKCILMLACSSTLGCVKSQCEKTVTCVVGLRN